MENSSFEEIRVPKARADRSGKGSASNSDFEIIAPPKFKSTPNVSEIDDKDTDKETSIVEMFLPTISNKKKPEVDNDDVIETALINSNTAAVSLNAEKPNDDDNHDVMNKTAASLISLAEINGTNDVANISQETLHGEDEKSSIVVLRFKKDENDENEENGNDTSSILELSFANPLESTLYDDISMKSSLDEITLNKTKSG